MTKSILLVEDDLDIQRIYSEKLKMNNYDFFITSDSENALTTLRQKPVDLILLDIMIPGKMNGMDFLKQVKDNSDTKNIPVIVLTNLDTEKDEAMKLGASDYFLKANMTPDDIIDKVKKYI